MKIERIKDMRFLKTATTLHKYKNAHMDLILTEESAERVRFRTMFDAAIPLASRLIDQVFILVRLKNVKFIFHN